MPHLHKILREESDPEIQEAVVDALKEIAAPESADEHYQYKTVITLGKIGSPKALSDLQTRLETEESRRREWRKIRNEDTDSYTDDEMNEWRKKLKQFRPKRYLEFELAFAISRIDPEGKGAELLFHDLSTVREGAWMALGEVGTVSLIERWIESERKTAILFSATRLIGRLTISSSTLRRMAVRKSAKTLRNSYLR